MRKLAALSAWLLLSFGLLGLSPGDPAPAFTAKNQDGKMMKLSDFKGKPLLLFFYPKDDTPGCTKEACNFRDDHSRIQALGAEVVGISRQGKESHQDFRSKHGLKFNLLTDEDGKIAE